MPDVYGIKPMFVTTVYSKKIYFSFIDFVFVRGNPVHIKLAFI